MFKYLKERREKKEKVKKLKEELGEIEEVRTNLLKEYNSKYNNNGLYKVEKTKVIDGNTSEEFEKKYYSIKKDFKKRESTMYLGDYDRIGDLINVRYSTPTYKNGVYFATIEYAEYELEEGLSKRDFDDMISTLIEYDKKYYKLKKYIEEI